MATSGGGLTVFDQYSNAKPLLTGYPSWVSDGTDRDRIAAYSLYEQIYWAIPEAFKLLTRGTDEDPIYIPAGRQIIDTINRFVAPKLQIITDGNFGTPAEQLAATQAITSFVRRERFYSRFGTAKREGIMRGDWVAHIYADPNRDPGSKISIFYVDPGSYFPIHNPENVDEIIGAHLAEYVIDDKGDPYIRRLTYRKVSGKGGPSPITMEEGLFKVDQWDGVDFNPYKKIQDVTELPAQITQLPLYHTQNFQMTGSPWGSSELRGMERLLAAVNQSISDEELSLALDGLGVYATTAGTPIDSESGEPVPWNLGPARVIELPEGTTFDRVSGVTSVSPFQDHLKYLHEQIDMSVGQSAVARGNVDVQIAESGIALAIRLGPTLSVADEKELIVTDVLTNMLYDLNGWFDAYEGINFGEAVLIPKYGDKVPVNRKQRFDEIMEMVTAQPPVVSTEWARGELRKIGYDIPDEVKMKDQIMQETQDNARITADAMGSRLDAELAAQTDTGTQLPAGPPGTE